MYGDLLWPDRDLEPSLISNIYSASVLLYSGCSILLSISPLTCNGQVTNLILPQVTDIEKSDIHVVGTSDFIKLWKFENVQENTVAVARV